MQIISADRIGIALIQEPYLYQNRLLGITKGYRSFTSGIGKNRAAIVISTNTIDALLITQLSDNDAVLFEIVIGNTQFFAASIYLDYNEPVENNIKSSENILKIYQRSKNYYSY
jgi:galactokinase